MANIDAANLAFFAGCVSLARELIGLGRDFLAINRLKKSFLFRYGRLFLKRASYCVSATRGDDMRRPSLTDSPTWRRWRNGPPLIVVILVVAICGAAAMALYL